MLSKCCTGLRPVLQEFAWTEDALPMRKAERGSSLGAESAAKLAEEPMFCFEVGQAGWPSATVCAVLRGYVIQGRSV